MKELAKCPFVGKIAFTKKDGGGVMDFTWDTEEVEFEIKEDWKVYKLNSTEYGFVGKDGVIYEGGIKLDGSVDPEATFFEKPVARVDMSGNKIAKFWKW